MNFNMYATEDKMKASGAKWASDLYADLLAHPVLLPNLGQGFTNELRAARKVQKTVIERLFEGEGTEMCLRDLSKVSAAFWKGAQGVARQLILDASTPPADEVF